jgi:AcrR family transcriptional regulator
MAGTAARRRQTTDSKRRIPARSNARATVAAIFEATARILQAEGAGKLSTNRIAERAGVSIGSVYAYFPNREAILLAMARRELDALRERVAAALAPAAGDGPDDPVRRAIRALVAGYGTRNKARRILMERLFASSSAEDMHRPVSEIANLIAGNAAHVLPPGAAVPSPIGLYVLTHAVDSVVRTATYDDAPFLRTRAFEDELVRLVRGYFAVAPAESAL